MKPQTVTRHTERICKVLDYLYAHSDAEPDLYTLADIACLSPYHFHRVYRGLVGETLMDTLREIRLAKAAGELAHGRLPLTRIARRAGFGSLPAFSRAFQQRYGSPPGRYRALRAVQPTFADDPARYPVAIVTESGSPLVGLPHQGDYDNIGLAFHKLFLYAAGAGWMQPPPRSIGIYYDDPEQVARNQLRAHAAISIDQLPASLPSSFETLHLPPGRVAVLRHTGPYADLHRAYAWLYGQWLPASDEEPGSFPVYEEYLNDPKTTPQAELVTLIHLPLA